MQTKPTSNNTAGFTQCSFLIVGSGAIGLSLAWELGRRGQSVAVIESSLEQHASASWAGAGILPPPATMNIDDPYDQLRAISHQMHPSWAAELKKTTGIDSGFRQCGGIYLATTPAEAATLTANQFWWDEHGIEYQKLNLTELLELEPRLVSLQRRRSVQAWRLPGECQLRNPRHLRALRRACELENVQFQQRTIGSLKVLSDRSAVLIDDQGGELRAEHICLCTGAWTRLLMQQIELTNGIMPVRGQMLLYHCDRPFLTHIINEGNRYLVPRDDGFLLAGSVEEEAGYNCVTTEDSLKIIQNWSEATLPDLSDVPIVNSWAGLRPGSYDGFPYMGLAPGTSNLFIAAGHFRSGLHMSCGTASIMADLMLGRPVAMDLTPFRIGRG